MQKTNSKTSCSSSLADNILKKEQEFYKDIKYWNFVGEDWFFTRFSPAEIYTIKQKAKIRDDSNKYSKKNYAKNSSLEGHIHGAAGEAAVYKMMGVDLNKISATDKPNNERHLGDLKGMEIKATTAPKDWSLYVNESTLKQGRVYVLTLTHFWPFCAAVMGWTYGHTILNDGELFLPKFRNKEKMYSLSWHRLQPIQTI